MSQQTQLINYEFGWLFPWSAVACAVLAITDAVGNGNLERATLPEATGIEPHACDVIVRHLFVIGVMSERDDGTVALTEFGCRMTARRAQFVAWLLFGSATAAEKGEATGSGVSTPVG
jgi:hypothetical protein